VVARSVIEAVREAHDKETAPEAPREMHRFKESTHFHDAMESADFDRK